MLSNKVRTLTPKPTVVDPVRPVRPVQALWREINETIKLSELKKKSNLPGRTGRTGRWWCAGQQKLTTGLYWTLPPLPKIILIVLYP